MRCDIILMKIKRVEVHVRKIIFPGHLIGWTMITKDE